MQTQTHNKTLLKQVDLTHLIDSITQTAKEVIDDARTVSLSSSLDPELTDKITANAASDGISVNAYLKRLISNTARPRNAGEKTINDIFIEFINSTSFKKIYKSEDLRDAHILTYHRRFKSVIGGVSVEQFEPSQLIEFYTSELNAGRSPHTIKNWNWLAVRIFKFAATQGMNVTIPPTFDAHQVTALTDTQKK